MTTTTSCQCSNHMGTQKQQHHTHQAALDAAIYQALTEGRPARIYPCPTTNRWHVTTRVRPTR